MYSVFCIAGVCSRPRTPTLSFIWSIGAQSPWKERRSQWRCGFFPGGPPTQSSPQLKLRALPVIALVWLCLMRERDEMDQVTHMQIFLLWWNTVVYSNPGSLYMPVICRYVTTCCNCAAFHQEVSDIIFGAVKFDTFDTYKVVC